MEAPIFLVGSGRSGTTLLHQMLSRHPAVFAAKGESQYFLHLPTIQNKFPDLQDDLVLRALVAFTVRVVKNGYRHRNRERGSGEPVVTEDHLDDMLAQASVYRSYAAVFSIVLTYLTQLAGKERCLEKTPAHIFHVDAIIRWMPGARFVEIERDPRDVLASLKMRKALFRQQFDEKGGPLRDEELATKEYDPLWETLEWKSTIRAGKEAKQRHPRQYYGTTYEQLVEDPEATLGDICDFLALPFHSDMLRVKTRNSSYVAMRGRKEGIDARSLGKWRKVLRPVEVALCQQIARKEMTWLGYALQPVTLVHKLQMPFVLLRSLLEIPVRIARQWRWRGRRSVLNALGNYQERFRALSAPEYRAAQAARDSKDKVPERLP